MNSKTLISDIAHLDDKPFKVLMINILDARLELTKDIEEKLKHIFQTTVNILDYQQKLLDIRSEIISL